MNSKITAEFRSQFWEFIGIGVGYMGEVVKVVGTIMYLQSNGARIALPGEPSVRKRIVDWITGHRGPSLGTADT